MATVQMDYTEATARETVAGFEIVRVAMVTDLTAASSGRSYEALTATGIPDIGDAHPSATDSVCTDKSCELIDLDKAMVRCTYREPSAEEEARIADAWMLEFSTAVSIENIDRDVNDDILEQEYDSGNITWQYRTDVQRPTQILRARKWGADYSALLAYTGKVNSTTWNGYGARTWLCVGITGTPGEWITLEFAEAPGGAASWDYTTPGWLAQANPYDGFYSVFGQQTYQVYEAADFSGLGITF